MNFNKIKKEFNDSIEQYNYTINFVNQGNKGYLDKNIMSKGKMNNGDMHKKENYLLIKSGMTKINNNWVINKKLKLNKKYNFLPTVIMLKKIIYQRCMRHRIEGWKDIKFNNIKVLNNHRKAIKWFINSIKNIINFIK